MEAPVMFVFFFFNDTATTEIYTLSLHDALPIFSGYSYPYARYSWSYHPAPMPRMSLPWLITSTQLAIFVRSEEHTSELQSLAYLVCRLLLENKKKLTSV